MCDRIIIFASNPGRIAHEIKVNLAHPRDRTAPAFRQMVDDIYGRMTNPSDPKFKAEQPTPEVAASAGVRMGLESISTNLLAGFMEALAKPPFDGKADLPQLGEDLQMEIDELFPIAESLQLLRFAEVAHGDIKLTDSGRHFVEAESDVRKRLFGQALVAHVPIVALIRRVLDERPTHTAPYRRFSEELEDVMSEEYADETMDAAINWGRYAELFAYDEQAGVFSLENPE
jgi:NitT/TauT family transport system ATP-binding protein